MASPFSPTLLYTPPPPNLRTGKLNPVQFNKANQLQAAQGGFGVQDYAKAGPPVFRSGPLGDLQRRAFQFMGGGQVDENGNPITQQPGQMPPPMPGQAGYGAGMSGGGGGMSGGSGDSGGGSGGGGMSYHGLMSGPKMVSIAHGGSKNAAAVLGHPIPPGDTPPPGGGPTPPPQQPPPVPPVPGAPFGQQPPQATPEQRQAANSGYSFGAGPGMTGTAADAWNGSGSGQGPPPIAPGTPHMADENGAWQMPPPPTSHVSDANGPWSAPSPGASGAAPASSGDSGTPRAWTGGTFPPGHSAIVGDRPNGSPGPNAEVVTAIPGGGFTVTPNPRNVGAIPRFADGTPPGVAYGADSNEDFTRGDVLPPPATPALTPAPYADNTLTLPTARPGYVPEVPTEGDSGLNRSDRAADKWHATGVMPTPSQELRYGNPGDLYGLTRQAVEENPPRQRHPFTAPAVPVTPPATRQLYGQSAPPVNTDANNYIASQQAEIQANTPWYSKILPAIAHPFTNAENTGIYDTGSPYQEKLAFIFGRNQTGETAGNIANAQSKIAFTKKWGYTPDYVPGEEVSNQVAPNYGQTVSEDPAFTEENSNQTAPNYGQSVSEEPPTPKKAWNDQQLNGYALRLATNERLGLKEGMPGWVDPNSVAEQMGAMPQTATPTQQVAMVDPAARANSILGRWQQEQSAPPEGTPPGLSPIAAQAWNEQRAVLGHTREGRAQILATEMGRLGADRTYSREIQMKNLESQNSFGNQQAIQDRKDARALQMAQKHQDWQQKHLDWRQQQEEAKNTPKDVPLPGGGVATMVNGRKVTPNAEPIHHQGFVPDDPNNPDGFGVHYDGATNKPERGVMGPDGMFHKDGIKPAKEEKINAYQIDPNTNKVTYLHHPPGLKTPPGVTLLEPDGSAQPQYNYTRDKSGNMVIVK